MSFQKDSFDATGRTVVAFETVNNIPNPNQVFGVSVTGSQCGVYGESTTQSSLGTRPPVEDVPKGTGVAGRGEKAGVQGNGPVGVLGTGTVGVSGVGDIGIKGQSSGDVEFKSHGVLGRSEKTAGVVGISGFEGIEGKNKFPSGQTGVFGFSEQGAGVFGSTTARSSHGVRGSSVNGDGMFGESKNGHGGVFQSGDASSKLVPQLQLIPQLMAVPKVKDATPQMFIANAVTALPFDGQEGDFLVTKDHVNNGVCTLWFCIQGRNGSTAAAWAQVLLGEKILGGG